MNEDQPSAAQGAEPVAWRFKMHPHAFGGPERTWDYATQKPTNIRGMAALEPLYSEATIAALQSQVRTLTERVVELERPVDMLLFCPTCGFQHVDAPESAYEYVEGIAVAEVTAWDNPPHKTHLCHKCGHLWRPADVPTNGVDFIKTAPTLISDPDKCNELLQLRSDLASARAEVERLRGALQAVTEALAEYTDTCEALDAGLAALAPQTKEDE